MRIGFIGLGNMGHALAQNLVARGHDVVGFDVAGASRCPDGAAFAASVQDVGGEADVVVLSLPDGEVVQQVATELLEARQVSHVVDTSTIGPAASRRVEALLAKAGLGYLDAPVSGGVAGARARTLAVMYAGPDEVCGAVAPVLADLSDRSYRVGEQPGMAQVLKLANNFLSATALAATSEAVAFAVSAGLDMATVLEVVNGSSGQSAASSDKFVNHVLTGRYASGFANTLMAKDLALYAHSVAEQGAPSPLGHITSTLWQEFAAHEPGVDFTRIYPFVQESPS
jgi:3-hydroxyisobutyrate dehydrogenase